MWHTICILLFYPCSDKDFVKIDKGLRGGDPHVDKYINGLLDWQEMPKHSSIVHFSCPFPTNSYDLCHRSRKAKWMSKIRNATYSEIKDE